MAEARLNLRGVVTLLVDGDHFTRGLIAGMLRGFGMDSPEIASNGAEAKEYFLKQVPDLILLDASLRDMESADLIRWIRLQKRGSLRFVPIITLCGYAKLRTVVTIRDAGANLVASKPISPQTLFDRLCWVARTERPFIESEGYKGPDRRFRDAVPPDGIRKRESDGDVADTVQSEPEPEPRGFKRKFGSN